MICTSLYSGSSANCVYVKERNTEILVDAGGSCKQIRAALQEIGTDLKNIRAILVTHEHSDHIKGVGTIAKNFGVPIYCQQKVAKEMYLFYLQKGCDNEAAALVKWIRTVQPGSLYEAEEITFSPFSTPHDSMDSCGYVLGEKELGIATDLGHVSEEVRNALLGCRNVILESNHDLKMLRCGPYPPYLKERIASDRGHLNNADCAAFAGELLHCGCRNLLLFHLSAENNRPEIAFRETAEALQKEGAAVGKDIRLSVAARREGTKFL